MSKSGHIVDLLVIGGGINGVGIARDAAGRGLSVVLCEQGDLSGATSWASSKLIHGGLRYLEHYEFRLVRESLAEREVLLHIAPHLVHPLRFVLPHVPELRPAWMIRAGLFLYDHLSRRVSLPSSTSVDLRHDPLGAGLKPAFRKAFAYSDCQVDDARLVIANARAAASLGARVLVRTACVGAEVVDGVWQLKLKDRDTDMQTPVNARALVNVAGPWVDEVAGSISGARSRKQTRLVKGSHIVVPRLHEGTHAYLLQNEDRRQVFVIPFEERYSLIGTTEVEVEGIPDPLGISAAEVDYLCRAVHRYFARRVQPQDVLWSFAGLRPLFGDSVTDLSAITRDYELDLELVDRNAPVLTVHGGKITTYRRLAEEVLAKLKPHLPYMKAPWTESIALPGGDMVNSDFDAFVERLVQEYRGFSKELLLSLAHRHGTLCAQVLGPAQDVEALGQYFGGSLYAREIDYLIDREWARSADDVLWRRTKTGLAMSEQQRKNVADYLARRFEPVKAKTLDK
ncbi:MAG: glycerol-3-phosphate dehydrogenase [Acidiferrobacterales bacterium]